MCLIELLTQIYKVREEHESPYLIVLEYILAYDAKNPQEMLTSHHALI